MMPVWEVKKKNRKKPPISNPLGTRTKQGKVSLQENIQNMTVFLFIKHLTTQAIIGISKSNGIVDVTMVGMTVLCQFTLQINPTAQKAKFRYDNYDLGKIM